MAATKASAVMAIVVLRQVTHHTTSLRKHPIEPAVIGIVHGATLGCGSRW